MAEVFFAVVLDFLAVVEVLAAVVVVAVSSFLWAQETNSPTVARAVMQDKTVIFIDLRVAPPES